MAFYNNFSLQHVLSEAPPSTTDLQSVKETTISSNNQKPIPKFNKKKHNAVESETSKTITPSENQQQAHKHLLSVTAHDKALQSPYPSKNQQRKTSQKNHRQSKKNNARKATEQHNDKPREILDLDFDTLLSYHEKAKPSKNAPIQDKPVGYYIL
jgi:glucan-binding YG repeat protein